MHHHIELSVKSTLTQLYQLLEELPHEDYGRALPILGGSSIGQHTRHVIEFFQTLANNYSSGVVNYEARLRNKLLERDSKMALQSLKDIIATGISGEDRKLILRGSYSNNNTDEVAVESTYHRELIYNLEHAIHHMAIIRIAIQNTTTINISDTFGMAASTIKYRESQ